jgi:hypothetical protein
MVDRLNRGEIDVAVALTEGLLSNALKTGDNYSYALAGTYVSSPLTWAVSVSRDLVIEDVKRVSWLLEKGRRVGVSRMGSGSQIIPFTVLQGQEPGFEFVICSNISGLVKSVVEESSDAFLWEKFTSRPYQGKGSSHVSSYTY